MHAQLRCRHQLARAQPQALASSQRACPLQHSDSRLTHLFCTILNHSESIASNARPAKLCIAKEFTWIGQKSGQHLWVLLGARQIHHIHVQEQGSVPMPLQVGRRQPGGHSLVQHTPTLIPHSDHKRGVSSSLQAGD